MEGSNMSGSTSGALKALAPVMDGLAPWFSLEEAFLL